jgi:hypothetical protein
VSRDIVFLGSSQFGWKRIDTRILQGTRCPPLIAGSNFHCLSESSAGFSKAWCEDFSTRGARDLAVGVDHEDQAHDALDLLAAHLGRELRLRLNTLRGFWSISVMLKARSSVSSAAPGLPVPPMRPPRGERERVAEVTPARAQPVQRVRDRAQAGGLELGRRLHRLQIEALQDLGRIGGLLLLGLELLLLLDDLLLLLIVLLLLLGGDEVDLAQRALVGVVLQEEDPAEEQHEPVQRDRHEDAEGDGEEAAHDRVQLTSCRC